VELLLLLAVALIMSKNQGALSPGGTPTIPHPEWDSFNPLEAVEGMRPIQPIVVGRSVPHGNPADPAHWWRVSQGMVQGYQAPIPQQRNLRYNEYTGEWS
jgi:hypothetical protein